MEHPLHKITSLTKLNLNKKLAHIRKTVITFSLTTLLKDKTKKTLTLSFYSKVNNILILTIIEHCVNIPFGWYKNNYIK